MLNTLRWKPDWPQARQALVAWWRRKGLALSVTAPKDEAWEDVLRPGARGDPSSRWLDADYWTRTAIYNLSRTFCGGAAVPALDTVIGGPGSLGLFLGAIGHPAPTTLWYEPVITNPQAHPPLSLDRTNSWWRRHLHVLQQASRENQGRYLVGMPDLIENIDTLAQLRDGQLLLVDMLERPGWVKDQIARINECYFEAYDVFSAYTRDPWGGSTFTAFGLWGPGRVAKVQCDLSCMISAPMFREFVVPALTAQCAWLDHSLYHLDGTTALHHLEALLEIEPLDAVEFTPQSSLPQGGSSQWYSLYRQIKAAGKSVQAVNVDPTEVEPLIDAVGAEGLYILATAESEAQARSLLERLGWPQARLPSGAWDNETADAG